MDIDSAYKGLSSQEAAKRLSRDGFNELTSKEKHGFFYLIKQVLKEPMIAILVIAGVLYLLLGEPRDALMLSTFIFFVVGVTFYQERKTENALSALKTLSSPRALVIRDGKQERVAGRDLVVGDFVIIKSGDRVPADAKVLKLNNLTADESILTGESLPVAKKMWKEGVVGDKSGKVMPTHIYAGTLVSTGWAIVELVAIGDKTQMGQIGKSLGDIKEEETLLHKETKKIVYLFTAAGAVVCLLVVALWVINGGSFLKGFLAGLTISMSMLPEEFPVVLTIFFTLGAWRLSKRKVLVRRTAIIETLGAATVLCVDKTGTLTTNSLQLENVSLLNSSCNLREDKEIEDKYKKVLEIGMLASEKEPFGSLDRTIKIAIGHYYPEFEKKYSDWVEEKEYPLTDKLRAVFHIWQNSKKKDETMICAKGAPEDIVDICDVDITEKNALLEKIAKLSQKGLRIIGVAKAVNDSGKLPDNPAESKFEFIGFLGFADPVREQVPEAVKSAYHAGIRTIMITGDFPGTAMTIAKKIGLTSPDNYLTGDDISSMAEEELQRKISDVNIFARVLPHQKLNIVNALKANGEIVAMTGDGVNDAPALKAAHIGISMGERGTDVAREASDIVLVNDDFLSIVEAVRTGRKIYENLRKAMAYIFSVHVPIAGMALLPMLFKMPLVLMPAHIAFLELIIDPTSSTVFEAEHAESGIMDHPPRNLKQPMFTKKVIAVGLMQGLSVLGIVFIMLLLSLYLGKTENEARTLAFTTLVFGNLSLIISNLSWRKLGISILHHASLQLRIVLSMVIIAMILVLTVPFLRGLFYFAPLAYTDILLAIVAGICSLAWFELLKLVKKRVQKV
ncbi:cation-translocating P-type ATPase [Patescibacteria group bacterium]